MCVVSPAALVTVGNAGGHRSPVVVAGPFSDDTYSANDAAADAAMDREWIEGHEFDDADLERDDECGCEDCWEGDEDA